MIEPGRTIGILGGGQLGRMIAQAAQRLGYRVCVFSDLADAPACQIAPDAIVADYGDDDALRRFAERVDVATFEFENLPADSLARLAQLVPVHPAPRVLKITQDRLREKDFINRLGIATTRFRAVSAFAALPDALAAIGRPAVLKSTRFGYDGKGQAVIGDGDDPAQAWRQVGSERAVLEAFVAFDYEASVIVARGLDGAVACFPPAANRHTDHILATSDVPAPLSPTQRDQAQAIGCRLAEALDLVGLLCVELFVTTDGALLVNELAPRPHNSGHWTLDACVTSQFEQLIRAICGLPLGSTERLADATMINLLGPDAENWAEILADPRAKLHLYGKGEARAGRKMGHATYLTPRPHQS